MHAILVSIKSSANPTDLKQTLIDFAHALKQRDGFIMKTWLSRDSVLGGFYVFTDRSSAERYVDEMLAPAVENTDGFSDLDVQHFGILDELSAVTHTPVAVSSEAALRQ